MGAFNNVKKCFETLPPHVTSECKEVLQGLLKRNPTDRMSCEDILNHPYLLPPRPSVDEGGEDSKKSNTAAKTKKKSLEKLPAAMEQNNFLSYQPSVAERYVDAILSGQKGSMQNVSSAHIASVAKDHMAGKVAG